MNNSGGSRSTKPLTGSERRQKQREWKAARLNEQRTEAAAVAPVGLVAQRRQELEGFIKTKRQEQRALGRWNLNAAGRNQGLVHIIDYAYAPPPRTQNKDLSRFLSNKSALGQTLIDQVKLDPRALSGNDLVAGGLSPTGKAAQKLSTSLQGQMNTLLHGLQGQAIGQRKRQDDFKALEGLKKKADARMLEQTYFTLAQDGSKGGRIKLVEESAGLKAGTFKAQGSEIRGVTTELGRLQAITAGTSSAPSNTPKQLDGWHKSGEKTAGGRTKWVTGAHTITDTAVSTELKTDSNNRKLKIMNWGPSSATQKHSTVMGA